MTYDDVIRLFYDIFRDRWYIFLVVFAFLVMKQKEIDQKVILKIAKQYFWFLVIYEVLLILSNIFFDMIRQL